MQIKNIAELVSIKEAAKILNVSTITLRRWDARGILKSFRPTPKSKRRYKKEDIFGFLNIKTKKIKDRNYYYQSAKIFPYHGSNSSIIDKYLNRAIKKNINYSKDYILGYPASTPLKIATESFKKFIKINSNNIGTHTRLESESGFKGTQELEREALTMIANLFNCNTEFDGYISSGGTEGNIMGIWILRNMINIEYNSKACFLKSPLTHYSLTKAFNLLNIDDFETIDINNNFGIDLKKLETKIRSLNIKGYKNFIIICTLGYSVTGSIDLIEEINFLVNILKEELKINIFIHVDASFGGFIYPFLTRNKIGFNLENVMTIALDAHKTGLVPYPCGVFLCRKNLQKFIETDVDYIRSHYDDTLIGSRCGAAAAALWSAIMSQGKHGYFKIYSDCIKNKNYLIKKLKKTKIVFWYYTHQFMNIIAIEFSNFPNYKLPAEIEQKYGLNLARIPFYNRDKNVYKLITMPHVGKKIISQFIYDLKQYNKIIKN